MSCPLGLRPSLPRAAVTRRTNEEVTMLVLVSAKRSDCRAGKPTDTEACRRRG